VEGRATVKITYLGHAGLLVEGAGKRIAIDPFLTGNPLATIPAKDLKADLIVLTHGHQDHTNDAAAIALANSCPIIAVVELAGLISRTGAATIGMNTGGTYSFKDDITIKLTPAFHSSSYEIDGESYYAGQAQGILLTIENQVLYHMGDTALFSDIKLIGELHNIDIAAVPIGDHFTMGPKEALLAAAWTKAKHVLPIHFNTFPPIVQDGQTFVQSLALQDQVGHELAPGQSIEV
jgi:L-ascorbate metabolism protein UlaG (beta-lactamase superfamily)